MDIIIVFSDGVASAKKSLFQVIQELVDSKWNNDMVDKECSKYSHCTPPTKEALYYRYVFFYTWCNEKVPRLMTR
jgi:asparagine synthase (glutamine-hydrolysing)